jgi:hypothetical protein
MTGPTPNSPVDLDLLSPAITAIRARMAVSLRSRARMSPRRWTAIWRRTFPAASRGRTPARTVAALPAVSSLSFRLAVAEAAYRAPGRPGRLT